MTHISTIFPLLVYSYFRICLFICFGARKHFAILFHRPHNFPPDIVLLKYLLNHSPPVKWDVIKATGEWKFTMAMVA